jgi:hypothetical protein
MNSQNQIASVSPALVITAVIALLISVAIACPTPDFLTLMLGIALALIPFMVMLTVAIRFVRRRGILLSRSVSVALGAGIGVSTGFLSVSASRFGSYLLF